MAKRAKKNETAQPALGPDDIEPETAAIMRQRLRPDTRWAAYRNVALDSANLGHLQFLLVGRDCTYTEPPEQFPMDGPHGLGWRYRFEGWADLETNKVVKEP